MMNIKPKAECKPRVCVEASIEWDGEKVAKELIEKIKVKVSNPKFILLFTTIDYKDDFKPILTEFKKAFQDVPLIGGTVVSFITRESCFAHGVTALALDYPNMDVKVGLGHKPKINPKKTVKDCSKMIVEGLKNSKYKNKLLINFISGPTIPRLPFIGMANMIHSKIFGLFFSYIGIKLASYFNSGIGKEEDILDEFALSMPEYSIIGCSLVDNGKFFSSYQFMGDKVYNDAVIAMGCSIDLPISLESEIFAHQTDKTFNITGSMFDSRIITTIENRPAKDYFFKNVLGLSNYSVKEMGPLYYKTSDYFPMMFEGNKDHVSGIGGFFGDSILMGHKTGGKCGRLLTVSGKEILDSMRSIFDKRNVDCSFMLIFSSVIYSFILGKRTYDIKEILDKYMGDKPYLMIEPMIENVRVSGKKPWARVYSFNVLSF